MVKSEIAAGGTRAVAPEGRDVNFGGSPSLWKAGECRFQGGIELSPAIGGREEKKWFVGETLGSERLKGRESRGGGYVHGKGKGEWDTKRTSRRKEKKKKGERKT